MPELTEAKRNSHKLPTSLEIYQLTYIHITHCIEKTPFNVHMPSQWLKHNHTYGRILLVQ